MKTRITSKKVSEYASRFHVDVKKVNGLGWCLICGFIGDFQAMVREIKSDGYSIFTNGNSFDVY